MLSVLRDNIKRSNNYEHYREGHITRVPGRLIKTNSDLMLHIAGRVYKSGFPFFINHNYAAKTLKHALLNYVPVSHQQEVRHGR